MSTTIGRDHVVNLVTGNPHPFAVHFDLVVVAHHAALGRATIHQVAARALAVISFERRVEALMPFIVACPVISFLRRSTYTKKPGERAGKQCNEIPPWNFHSISSSAKESGPAVARPSALAALRLITKSNLRSAAGLFTFRQRRLHPQSSDGLARWISSWSLHSSSNVNV